MDANLNHCLATGRSATGCLHFVNHTPIDSYSKRQVTVETATDQPVLCASRVLGSNPGCLFFIRHVDFVCSAFQSQVGCLHRADRDCSPEEYPDPQFL